MLVSDRTIWKWDTQKVEVTAKVLAEVEVVLAVLAQQLPEITPVVPLQSIKDVPVSFCRGKSQHKRQRQDECVGVGTQQWDENRAR
jgi:hypothetical protein